MISSPFAAYFFVAWFPECFQQEFGKDLHHLVAYVLCRLLP
jgi:hypothetical protein